MKRFNWITTLLLNFVTFGIYSIYAWYTMGKQHNELAEQIGEKKVMNYIGVFFLSFVTCGIFPIIWMYQYYKLEKALADAKGVQLTPTDSPIVLLLLMFVPFYGFYVLCENNNKICDAYEA